VGAAPLLPAHHRRHPPVLRRPQLPLHRRQTRPQLFQRPRHARPRRALDARCYLIKPHDFKYLTSYLTATGRAAVGRTRNGDADRSHIS